jgi:hypothetical protein
VGVGRARCLGFGFRSWLVVVVELAVVTVNGAILWESSGQSEWIRADCPAFGDIVVMEVVDMSTLLG